MSLSEKNSLRLLRFSASCAVQLYTGLLYFLSLVGPLAVCVQLRHLPVYVLLAIALIGYGFAGLIFLLMLVLTKRLLGRVETGITSVRTTNGQKYFLTATLISILESSPFKSMAVGISLCATCFYRGMGAKMPPSVLIGPKSLIHDPWFLEVGENVNIGTGAMILGHLGHGKDIILGKVRIRDGAVIGVNAVIFPDVEIGRDARVGAGAIVTRGTVIADGEVWLGIPARKYESSTEKICDG